MPIDEVQLAKSCQISVNIGFDTEGYSRNKVYV